VMDLTKDEDDAIARGPDGMSGGIGGPGPPPGELVLLVMHLVIDVDAGIKPPRQVTVEETMGGSWGNRIMARSILWDGLTNRDQEGWGVVDGSVEFDED
jgi:hypothetical protein